MTSRIVPGPGQARPVEGRRIEPTRAPQTEVAGSAIETEGGGLSWVPARRRGAGSEPLRAPRGTHRAWGTAQRSHRAVSQS
jgi:hypothetical protein